VRARPVHASTNLCACGYTTSVHAGVPWRQRRLGRRERIRRTTVAGYTEDQRHPVRFPRMKTRPLSS
jgi:hypothetical protein